MRSLLYAEWIRLRVRPDLLVLLVGSVALSVAAYLLAMSSQTRIPDLSASDQPALLAAARFPYLFPQSAATMTTHSGLLTVAAGLLGAIWLGNEFSWRSIREVLLAEPRRQLFLGVRLAAVLVLSTGACALLFGVGLALSALTPSGPVSASSPDVWAGVALTLLSSWLAVIAYGCIGVAAAAVFKSAVAAVVATLGFLVFDQLASTGAALAGASWANWLLLDARIADLSEHGMELAGLVPRSDGGIPWVLSVGVASLWAVGAMLVAGIALASADISG
jgi:hypothetical protein